MAMDLEDKDSEIFTVKVCYDTIKINNPYTAWMTIFEHQDHARLVSRIETDPQTDDIPLYLGLEPKAFIAQFEWTERTRSPHVTEEMRRKGVEVIIMDMPIHHKGCFICGLKDHIKATCPELLDPNNPCNRCGAASHKTENCRTGRTKVRLFEERMQNLIKVKTKKRGKKENKKIAPLDSKADNGVLRPSQVSL